ncbi:MAG: CHAT domain-containing protein [Cyanobacteria bacterium P01_A01_bin.83]
MSATKIGIVWGLTFLLWGVFNPSDVSVQSLESSSLLEKSKVSLGQHQRNVASRLETAETSNISGDRYWQSGQFEQAISVWKQEASTYHDQENKNQEIKTLLKIGQGYISLGQFNSAIVELKRVMALEPSDSSLALTQTRLGNAYQGVGKLKEAISYYKSSLKKKKSLSTINNLVEAFQSQSKYNLLLAEEAHANDSSTRYHRQAKQNRALALKYAQQALTLSNQTNLSSVRALINWQDISGRALDPDQLEKGSTILKTITPSRKVAFLMLNWADLDRERKATWLTLASDMALALNDSYLKSYVFLELGYFHKELGDLELAANYAQKAQLFAQSEFATDSLFRAQHLAGQIYQKLGDRAAALTAYKNAIASLDLLNQDSVTIDIEQRINFRIQIEPIYQEALKLLLDRPKITKVNLVEALNISDKLRLAQLQNYFGEDCLEIKEYQEIQDSQISGDTASINSIILDEKVFFILRLDNGEIHYSQANIGRREISKLANQWNQELKTTFVWEFRRNSRQFYDLIIKPFESKLEAKDPEILVFIHDGILRNLPMAALFDGEKFLAQKWASVSSIGLNFTGIPVEEKETKVAAFGLQADIPGWSKLENVAEEIKDVQDIVGGNKFLNQQFTVDNLYRQLDEPEYSIVHLATHGYFGGAAETSFILAYDQKLSALQLEDVLNKSEQILDLVVLSACETAAGSDRAILGLAGVAARSGVKSTLGSFWQVQDKDQSQMIEAFYTYWKNPNYNKATALQKVQIEQIEKYAHPAQWASLTLIGDHQ